MAMTLGAGEPPAGPWRVLAFAEFVRLVREQVGSPAGRPPVLAVDGRSSSGKTTLSARLADALPGAAVVHTDDIAWWHAPFGWADLLVGGVLEPVRRGEAVAYRPPKWDERNRPGAVVVPPGAALVIVEGVGAGRRELSPLLDGIVWVQSDQRVIDERNAVRVAAGETTPSDHAAWMGEEVRFVAEERTWERALAIVAGTPPLPHDPSTQVVVAADRLPD
jgi:hypothetical protein